MGTGMAQADMHKENGGIGSMKTGTIHVETGPVGRTLFLFAVPVIISQVLQEFYNIVDCAIVGHFAGGTALAAAGVSGLILSVLVNFFIGFSSGVSVITSRLFGEYAYAKLKTMISGVVKLVLAVGIIFTIGMLFLAGSALDWIHCPDNVRVEAGIYLKICLCGLTAQLLYNVVSAILRSLGDTRTPMLYFLGSFICNLILDLLLVVVFPLGIRGAAIATVTGQWCGAIAALLINHCFNPEVRPALRPFRFSIPSAREILRIGIPTMIMHGMNSVMSFGINRLLLSVSATAVASYGVYYKLQNFLTMPLSALGQDVIPIMGFNYGAKNAERIRQAVRSGLFFSAAVAALRTILFQIFPSELLSLFNAGKDMLSIGVPAIRIISVTFLFSAITTILGFAVSGLGNGDLRVPRLLLKGHLALRARHGKRRFHSRR